MKGIISILAPKNRNKKERSVSISANLISEIKLR